MSVFPNSFPRSRVIPDGVLDLFTGAFSGFSLRRLSKNHIGAAIRVRRSSDNTERDIGFVDGELDTRSLISFCGSGNGFVKVWYDQAGSGINALQLTTATQPQIVVNGTVNIENGKPAMIFSSSFFNVGDTSTYNFLHNGLSTPSVIAVCRFGTTNDPNAAYAVFGTNGNGSANIGNTFFYDDRVSQSLNNSIRSFITFGTPGQPVALTTNDNAVTPNRMNVLAAYYAPAAAVVADRAFHYLNNTILAKNNVSTNAPVTTNATFNLQIGAAGNTTNLLTGAMQEIIFFTGAVNVAIQPQVISYYNV